MAESRLPDFKRLFREVSPLLHWRTISEHLGVTRQHVYRLRNQLHAYEGIWLDEHKFDSEVPRGYFRWPQNAPFDEDVLVSLTTAEIEALKTAAERVDSLTPLVKQTLKKLSQGKPLERALETDPVLYTPLVDIYPPNLFTRVAKAIRERRVAEVIYQNARGETKRYKFNAFVLIPNDPHLHLVGVSHSSLEAGHSTVIRLRLDQVLEFKLCPEHFPKPDFDVRAYAAREFGPFQGEGEPVTVRVCFSSEKAQFIRRTLRHVSQQTEDAEDGGVIWSISAPLTEHLVHWVSSYGPHARVLEPLELKERVRAWAQGSADVNG